jgi:outer membrane biosynthesis protein TonB
MKSSLVVTILAALLASVTAQPLRSGPAKIPHFVPPDVASATAIPFPPDSLAAGVVTLSVSLDSTGKIQSVTVVRDLPSMTGVVTAAVQSWTFTPATLNGSAVPSTIYVSAVFNLFNPGGAASQTLFLAPPQSLPAAGAEYAPPQITSASFATYPPNSVASGTVVLDVTVNAAGQAAKVRVVRDVPSLTAPSVSAVKTWGFNSATVKNQPIAAKTIIAFVFQRSLS